MLFQIHNIFRQIGISGYYLFIFAENNVSFVLLFDTIAQYFKLD